MTTLTTSPTTYTLPPAVRAQRVAVTWNLASGISSGLHVLQQWCDLHRRRSEVLSDVLRSQAEPKVLALSAGAA
jgi:hypothetical protein